MQRLHKASHFSVRKMYFFFTAHFHEFQIKDKTRDPQEKKKKCSTAKREMSMTHSDKYLPGR